MNSKRDVLTKQILDSLYDKFTREHYAAFDPVKFMLPYEEIEEREIIGLIASSLAYGRASQICVSVDKILSKIEKPVEYIKNRGTDEFTDFFRNFKHRYTTGSELIDLLIGIKSILAEHGSLGNFILSNYNEDEDNISGLLRVFAAKLLEPGRKKNSLIPMPDRGSAFKRLSLFFRWMVRRDDVDPGGWDFIPASKLIIPLDTHIHRVGLKFGLTARKQNDMKTAVEITNALKEFDPEDPVRYDFALTQFGIHDKLDTTMYDIRKKG